jgi:CRP/FNR family transcriptional regulator, cyclic AMP receptor protein
MRETADHPLERDRTIMTEPPRLADHGLCEVLSSRCRGALCEQAARGPARRVEAGQLLYHVGGEARSVFLIRCGLVKTSVVSARGQELTLRLYTAGDIVGELCLCTQERREQAVALEPSDVVEIPLELLTARLLQNPQAALELAAALCERMADAEERLRSIATDPVLERLVRTLLTLATVLGEPTAEGMQIRYHLAQEELARLVGARREVISSLMNRLRGQGLLTYTRRGLIVVDHQRLVDLRDWLGADCPDGDPMLAR